MAMRIGCVVAIESGRHRERALMGIIRGRSGARMMAIVGVDRARDLG
jgi:hypothetical protein